MDHFINVDFEEYCILLEARTKLNIIIKFLDEQDNPDIDALRTVAGVTRKGYGDAVQRA